MCYERSMNPGRMETHISSRASGSVIILSLFLLLFYSPCLLPSPGTTYVGYVMDVASLNYYYYYYYHYHHYNYYLTLLTLLLLLSCDEIWTGLPSLRIPGGLSVWLYVFPLFDLSLGAAYKITTVFAI
ncbi:hypothetical protein GQ53DRAFT_354072 [Thozetella sp. PMI_491]|nr:hypothetical protein GQ53DRAFT_354072 [Thozetella sp. PMI_491]